MADTPGYQVTVRSPALPRPPARPPARLPRSRARHRLGTPGLRSCRTLGATVTPGPARHRRPVPPRRRRLRSAALALVLGTLMVSGWLAASGATAFAEMIGP